MTSCRLEDVWHAYFPTARRTLCLLAIPPWERTRQGRRRAPSCEECRASIEEQAARRLRGIPPHFLDGAAASRCGALNQKGEPCGRAPMESGYCHSHAGLAAAA